MITGRDFRDAILSAAHEMSRNRERIDALNVFPVPDGDTGSNMTLTLRAAAGEAALLPDDVTAAKAAETTASALLRGARGNSGVILSIIFRGISHALRGKAQIDSEALAQALTRGAEKAYSAVMKPIEGTILTVARAAAEQANDLAAREPDPVKVFLAALDAAQAALAKTPEQLPALKKAGVVDAGGSGLVCVMTGMASVFTGQGIVEGADEQARVESARTPVFEPDAEIRFGYCTEFLISKRAGSTADVSELRAYLESVGDCVVAVDDADIIKVHVHTNEPGNVLQRALTCGELINIKIDNMRYEHKNAGWGANANAPAPESVRQKPAVEAPATKQYGFVAVASGEGLMSLFREMGADGVVSGGQTMNPSTEDILDAIRQTPAEVIYVLPNNKNIIMAAEQAVKLTKRQVYVLRTVSVPEGIAALLAFDDELSPERNSVAMQRAADAVGTVQVTYAARDASVDGVNVRKGDIMALENGRITYIERDPNTAAFKAARHLAHRNTALITVYYGDGVTEQAAAELTRSLQQKFDDAEVTAVNGGQSVYYYIIAIE